jgi:hypothetical protein
VASVRKKIAPVVLLAYSDSFRFNSKATRLELENSKVKVHVRDSFCMYELILFFRDLERKFEEWVMKCGNSKDPLDEQPLITLCAEPVRFVPAIVYSLLHGKAGHSALPQNAWLLLREFETLYQQDSKTPMATVSQLRTMWWLRGQYKTSQNLSGDDDRQAAYLDCPLSFSPFDSAEDIAWARRAAAHNVADACLYLAEYSITIRIIKALRLQIIGINALSNLQTLSPSVKVPRSALSQNAIVLISSRLSGRYRHRSFRSSKRYNR